MTRQDFVFVADVLRQTRPVAPNGDTNSKAAGAYGAWLTVAEKFADELALTNVSFDRERFMAWALS